MEMDAGGIVAIFEFLLHIFLNLNQKPVATDVDKVVAEAFFAILEYHYSSVVGILSWLY